MGLRDAVINEVNSGSVYPGSGVSLGIQGNPMFMGGSGMEPSGAMEMQVASSPGAQQVANAAMTGAQGSAAAWWLVIAISLFLLMFVAKRFGSEGGDFANIKLSVYNVLVIGFAAVIGMTLLKAAFTKVPIPGLSSLILAA